MDNGWEKHQLLVLNELERLTASQDKMLIALQNLRVDFEKLKTESTLRWGLVSAVVASAVSIAMRFV